MALPPLNAVKTFEVAARHLSFTRAANELNVTPGAVSRAVAQLEDRLQIPLFRQHKRRLQLTPAGQAYYFQVSKALERLVSATDELQQHQGSGGMLSIGILPTFGTRWFIPRLVDFQQQHPAISVDVKTLPSDFSRDENLTSNVDIDLDQYDIDVALYLGRSSWPGVSCEHLFKECLVPVASPCMEEELIRLVAGERNALDNLLLHSTRPQVWHYWFEQQGFTLRDPQWRARFEHYFMVIEAAVSGLGIALLPEVLIVDELKSGRLVTVKSSALEQPYHYSLLYHTVRQSEKKILYFREWLNKQLM